MGGAFIGVADDATAASWNPAGLIQLDLPEISLVAHAISREEDLSFGTNPEASGTQSVSDTGINYLSVAYPFQLWGRNMVVSLNSQHLFDFTREWNFHITETSDGGTTSQDFQYQQDGALSAVGLAWSMRVNPQISLGLTLNIWNDDLSENEWEQSVWSWGTVTNDSQSRQTGMRSLDR